MWVSLWLFFIWKVDLSIFNNGMCVVPLAPAVMTMSGVVCHPLLFMSFINGWYLSIFLCMESVGNLSLVYVNSINCIVVSGRILLGRLFCDKPLMHSISRLSLSL